MMLSVVPVNETLRLKALTQLAILDTPPEPGFDGLVHLAAELCQTPIALISLSDQHRHWFKAKVGLWAESIPRNNSFCDYALAQPHQPLIIPDTTADARFRHHPLVVNDPQIRFYAGVPLVTKEGLALGTLCVLDQQPRVLPPEKVAALQRLAQQAVWQVELHCSNQQLALANQQLQENIALQETLVEEISDLYNQSPYGYHSLDANGWVLRMNDTELKWLGYTREEMVGKLRLREFVSPLSVKVFDEFFPLLKQQGWVKDVELEFIRRDGSTFPVLLNATAIYDNDGNFLMSRSTCTDLTKRHWAEEALRVNEKMTRSIIENLAVGLITTAEHGVIEFSNPLAASLFGYAQEEMIGVPLSDLFPTVGAATSEEFLAGLLQEALGTTQEYEGQRRDGSTFLAELSLFTFHANECRYIACNVMDITERRNHELARVESLAGLEKARNELELKVQHRTGQLALTVRDLQTEVLERLRAEEELRQLSHRLVEVQEAERQHLARELHDEVGQLLTGLKLLLEMGEMLPAAEQHEQLTEAKKLVNELQQNVRQLSLDLRPGMLDDLGLRAALLWHLNRFETQTRIAVHFVNVGIEAKRFAARLETAAFRIVQESLTNVARYAGVTQANVRVWADDTTLNVQIEDQGCGFDPLAAIAAGCSSGLTGMRERAMLLGGTLEITSEPNNGTSVMATFPLH